MTRTLFALSALALAGCSHQPGLPVFGQVPRFTLTAQNGGRFDSDQLAGRIWVADFFFSRCTGPCPRMGSQMRWVTQQVKDLGARVRFVSFTVDPDHDTPSVLAAYARRFRANDGQWYFLTGPRPTLQGLDRNVFKLGDVDGSFMHSTRFVLIDARGRIRGYYETDQPEGLDPLVRDIRRLARES